jgi:cysteine desulfuration protein SufE
MTINEIQDKIITDFSRFPDWIDKCEYLIGLGKSHTIIDTWFKVEQYMLRGCQSQVWIYAEVKDHRLSFLVDSDSVIIKGVLVLLLRVLNNQQPKDVAQADLYFIKAVGLSTNLSPTRANGVASIIKQMRNLGEVLGG